MSTATLETLTRRTPEAITRYGIKDSDTVSFNDSRPVVILRQGCKEYGISLEYSYAAGAQWQIMSFHETVAQAIDAFHNVGLGKDRDPRRYRILKDSI